MAKLRTAICGQRNTNLDDLPHMTGNKQQFIVSTYNMLKFRIPAHWRHRKY